MYIDFQHNDLADTDGTQREALQKAFEFDQQDIAANRTGRLSTPQMTRLLFRGLGPFLGLVATAVGVGALFLGLWVSGPSAGIGLRLAGFLGKYLIVGIGTLFFGVVGFIMKLLITSGTVFQLILDLIDGKTTSVSGRTNTSKLEEAEDGLATFTREKTASCRLVIKGECFEVSEAAFEVMLDRSGSNFKAYVTPRSRFLVAIEPAVPDPEARDPFKYKSEGTNSSACVDEASR